MELLLLLETRVPRTYKAIIEGSNHPQGVVYPKSHSSYLHNWNIISHSYESTTKTPFSYDGVLCGLGPHIRKVVMSIRIRLISHEFRKQSCPIRQQKPSIRDAIKQGLYLDKNVKFIIKNADPEVILYVCAP